MLALHQGLADVGLTIAVIAVAVIAVILWDRRHALLDLVAPRRRITRHPSASTTPPKPTGLVRVLRRDDPIDLEV